MHFNHVNGVTFDGLHSYYDLGEMWISKDRPDLGSPEPKLNIVDVPGSDGFLDLTESNSGEVKFNTRYMVFTFVAMVPEERQESFKEHINSALHGKYIKKIILDEDPEWYYSGRATVFFSDINDWKLKIVVNVEAEPYATRIEQTVFSKDLYDDDFMVISQRPLYTDVSAQLWNTDFRFGTELYPMDFSAYSKVVITWPDNAVRWNLPQATVYVYDADGGGAHFNFTLQNLEKIEITILDMVDEGVNPDKIYRILVSGIGGCGIIGQTERSAFLSIRNSRKTIMPIWNVTASGSVTAYLNGNKITIQNFDGFSSPDIQLINGNNDLIIPYSQTNRPSKVVVRYTEGKL